MFAQTMSPSPGLSSLADRPVLTDLRLASGYRRWVERTRVARARAGEESSRLASAPPACRDPLGSRDASSPHRRIQVADSRRGQPSGILSRLS